MKQAERFAIMRQESEAKIKAAATKLFANKSVDKTTIANIAHEAGVSTGLAYRYFGSKQEIFDEIIGDAINGLENLAAIFQVTDDPRSVMTKATEQLLRVHDDEIVNLDVSILMMQTFFQKDDDHPKLQELLAADENLINTIADLIQKGQDLGQFKKGNPHDMATFYLAQYQGVTFMAATLKSFVVPTHDMFLSFILDNK